MGSIFLQMLGSLLAPPSLFHIMAHDIILLSGVVHSYSMYYYSIIFYYFLLTFFSSATHEELFNLWHAKAQNVIERSFGVIKQQFKILIIPPEYSGGVQAWLFPALAAVHNFIPKWDPVEIADIIPPSDNNINIIEYFGQLATEYPRQAEKEEANARRDQIAEDMWNDYQRILREM